MLPAESAATEKTVNTAKHAGVAQQSEKRQADSANNSFLFWGEIECVDFVVEIFQKQKSLAKTV